MPFHDEYVPELCSCCNGSGEGYVEDSRCASCRGSGEKRTREVMMKMLDDPYARSEDSAEAPEWIDDGLPF